MPHLRLDEEQVDALVRENVYILDKENAYKSRCFDGNYTNAKFLPTIAFPGGDLGTLAVIYASAQSFGLEIETSKVFDSLITVIGGIEGFSAYKSQKSDDVYTLIPFIDSLDLSSKYTEDLIKQYAIVEAKSSALHELPIEQVESAVLRLKGDFGLYPQYKLSIGNSSLYTQVYTIQQTHLDARNKILAEQLVADKAVILPAELDSEYLYQAMSDMSDDFYHYALQSAKIQLPFYNIAFDSHGNFEIETF